MKSRTTAALTTTLLLAACGSGGSDNQDNSMTDTENNCSNTANRSTLLRPALLASAISLAGCDPQFESTSDACRIVGDSNATLPRQLFTEENATPEEDRVAAFNDDENTSSILDASGNQLYWLRARNSDGDLIFDSQNQQVFLPDYSANASTNENDFKLYFEDYFNSLAETDVTPESNASNRTLAFSMLSDIQEILSDTFALDYTIENDKTIKSQNALDFLSSREVTDEDNLLVGTFEIGRARVAQAISEDVTCAYRDRSLQLLNDPFHSPLRAIYDIFFNPFESAQWVQSTISTETPKGKDETLNLSGFYFTDKDEFQERGYAEPSILRTASSAYQDPSETQADSVISMSFTDRYAGDTGDVSEQINIPLETDPLTNSQVISLILSTNNALCLQKDENGDNLIDEDTNLVILEQCENSNSWEPRRSECARPPTDEELEEGRIFRDETNSNKEFWITVGGQNYKRVRVDIDFKYDPDGDGNASTLVQVFGSEYSLAIENGNVLLDSSGNLVASTDSDNNVITDDSGNVIFVTRLTDELTEASDQPLLDIDGRTIYEYKGIQLFPEVIEDPTECEQTAVSVEVRDRAIAFGLESEVRRRVADPNYDREITLNTVTGETLSFTPTPIYEYVGTPIINRNPSSD